MSPSSGCVFSGEAKFYLCLLALVLIGMSLIVPFDRLLHDYLLPLSNSRFATLWAHGADFLGNGVVLIMLVVALSFLIFFRTGDKYIFRTYLIRATLAIGITGVIGQILKFVIGRPRPGTGLDSWQISPFCTANDFHSFPSGHAASAFSVALILCHYFPRLRYLWLAMALFVSLGRLVGQSHFLTDLVGSIVIALLVTDLVLNAKWKYSSFLFLRSHTIRSKTKARCA